MSECPGVAPDLGKPRHTRAPEPSAEQQEKGSPSPDPRCTATAASTGQRCRQRALSGHDRCRSHLDPEQLLALLDARPPDPFTAAADLLDPPEGVGS